MNIPFFPKHKNEAVTACIARDDGGYLVRLTSGRHGSPPTRLAVGTAAVLRRTGVVEAVR